MIRARRREVCAAERRKKIVERHFVGQILHRKAKRDAPALLFVKQVVGADADVKQVARPPAPPILENM